MINPICFALDVNDLATAQRLVDQLEEHVEAFKVGLELFIAGRGLPKTKRPIVLDLKLHDIPETVERAVKAGADLGVKFMTLHVQQRRTLEQAAKAAAYNLTLLGVTVLTSMSESDLDDLGMVPATHISQRVLKLVRHGIDCGLHGFVCSPQEIATIRRNTTTQPLLLVPGVRPAGSSDDDQRRIGTPKQAVQDGADLIVIGRPIRDAADPVAAAQAILMEVQA